MMDKIVLSLDDLSKVSGGDFFDFIKADDAFGVYLVSRIMGDIVFISVKDFDYLKNMVVNKMGWKDPSSQEDFIANYCINKFEYEKYDDFITYRRGRHPRGYQNFKGNVINFHYKD